MLSPRNNRQAKSVFILWFATLVCIPLLSINGRFLQRIAVETAPRSMLALVFIVCSVLLLGLLAYRGYQNDRRWVGFHMSWATALFVLVPLMLPTVEERLHFIVFGLFGYMSVLNWGTFKAVYICQLAGLLDEILQWMLPDRVGDWRDVWFNWIACFGGIILGHFLGKDHETVHHSTGNTD